MNSNGIQISVALVVHSMAFLEQGFSGTAIAFPFSFEFISSKEHLEQYVSKADAV